MRIDGIQPYTYTRPAFGSFFRSVSTSDNPLTQQVLHRNNTWFFRPNPQYWHIITNFIIEKYKNVPKVNVYNYGCSNGIEPYSFIIMLVSKLGRDGASKFLPIIAKDYDEYAIKMATSGKLELDPGEWEAINSVSDGKVSDYLKLIRKQKFLGSDKYENVGEYEVSQFLKNSVNYSTADILEDYKNIDPNNSIVFARNFWPYLAVGKKRELAEKLYAHLGTNSILIIGNYDHQREGSREDAPSELERVGFQSFYIPDIYFNPSKQQPVQDFLIRV